MAILSEEQLICFSFIPPLLLLLVPAFSLRWLYHLNHLAAQADKLLCSLGLTHTQNCQRHPNKRNEVLSSPCTYLVVYCVSIVMFLWSIVSALLCFCGLLCQHCYVFVVYCVSIVCLAIHIWECYLGVLHSLSFADHSTCQ